ncbi:MAG TPA: YciI family protein [Vicinamibacteria bacterium]|nr:YciI family protein [Vicinamibacteria bacterium]
MKMLAPAALALGLAATAAAQAPAASPAAAHSPGASEWKAGEPPTHMTTYYLVMLVKGPKWAPDTSPAPEQLRKDHLTHLRKLALAGKLVLAGPLTDDGTIRGLVLFKAASLEEARALEEDDPLVKAGRLAVEVHPWMVQKGILP